MEWLIAAGGNAENVDKYDCITSTRKAGNVNRVVGVSFIVYGMITELVYILVLSVMVRKRHRQLSCYKIMIVLGFYDMCQISINCVLSGYFHLTGANYCVNPTLIYITGDLTLGLWCGTCLNCLVLVVNRLVDIWDRHYLEMFFKGKRTYVVLLLPFAYLLYFTFFTPPVLFNSDHAAWFFAPFTTNHKIEEYVNYPHSVNNILIVPMTTLMYVLYAKLLLRSSRGSKLSWAQKSFFFQTTSICMSTAIGSLVYVYMQFFETPAYFVLIGHLSWIMSNGFPAFVYLILNRTIGGEVLKTLKIQKWKSSTVATTNTSKVVASNATASQI